MKAIACVVSLSAVLATVMGCTHMSGSEPVAQLKDDELTIPAGYRSWPKFLAEVQRPDVKQIRDIYLNPIGHKTKSGEAFPYGSISVMEIYKAKTGPDGELLKGADGKLVKGDLAKVFVMGKNKGWGQDAPAELKTGEWIYAGYLADGKTPSGDKTSACRTCHVPAAKNDFVLRYDEYFQKRGG